MNKLLAFLAIVCIMTSCSEKETETETGKGIYEAPYVTSYTTYISENSVRLNGFIDLSNRAFLSADTYKVGFIFRAGDENDSSNDQVIELEGKVDYYTGTYVFSHDIDSLEPNTTYYYTAYTINGSDGKDNWISFTTSAIPCAFEKDNYYSFAGTWKSANVEITDPNCCSDGNVGFRFGTWPDIFEIRFNELNNGYPKTGQYFGVNYEFDISNIQRELVKSSNQALMEYYSTPETELFVNNDGERLTLIFCNTILRDGNTLNGKVSVKIP
ncbi:hypothetical protein CJ739_3866 [Mariniflexile rhizosphaerae]|uniref:hypothetical protein n=1 Tax=unclassified Mariniflexile TaxID=2643887 RepID=UPI000E3362D6|nr:hypothetical protein [Mariniflexile sp. TRM1-10]AXP82925.1 hypothetical protein CJ739_3866 [Mariniflexile sp. TRM1-10]